MDKVRLNINKISPGMKLAEPITNPAGITLMPAGIRLTPMFIARIKKWNVEELDVFVEKPRDTAVRKPLAPMKTATKAIPRPQSATAAHSSSEQEKSLSADEEDFARTTAIEISRPFVNVKNNPIMMQLRAVVIKRLVMHGSRGAVNILRKGIRPGEEQEAT